MSFSKGWKDKVKPDEEDWDGYRDEHQILECAYPNCRNKKITRDQDAVCWDSVHLPNEEMEFNLSPLAKLAVAAHPKTNNLGGEWGHYFIRMSLHAECAAEWGMHLIKDALQSHNVGTKLRSENQNAIRKQT